MRILLVVILVGASLAILGQTVSRARDAYRQTSPAPRFRAGRTGGGIPRSQRGGRGVAVDARGGSGFLDHRWQIRLMRERFRLEGIRDDTRNRAKLAFEWARHRMRMEQRDHEWERKHPQGVKIADPADAPPPAAPPPDPGAGRQPGPGTVPGKVVEDPPAASSQAPPESTGAGTSPPPTQPQSKPGGNPMSSGAVEQAVDGTQGIHARAASGGIRAKQWAVKACAEVFTRLSAMMLMLSRTLADARYGPEITEPLAQAAQFASAAAMACGQADTAITSLANMTVGELADSPRQAPHHDELSETGSR